MEDNVGDANLVREALNEHAVRCELIVVDNGETAIQLIDEIEAGSTDCPKLVIVDLNLPKRSGAEVLQRMLASKKCAGVPVVILSSSDNVLDKANAARLGAHRYFTKPSRLNEFLALGSVFRQMLDSAP